MLVAHHYFAFAIDMIAILLRCCHILEQGGTRTKSILTALKAGYRLVDTAKRYGTEKNVAAAIQASGLDRKDIFVTSKLWHSDAARVRQACEESCKRLGGSIQ